MFCLWASAGFLAVSARGTRRNCYGEQRMERVLKNVGFPPARKASKQASKHGEDIRCS